ncbi:MAG: CHAD domain-containing protein [Betaproteobacteria bacterium]|nr:CHAD domain-containing protein [Betaproteobacteria bacterium]
MDHPGRDMLLPDLLPTEKLLAALAAEFGLDAAPECEASVVYADSFDWRLYRKGYLLHCHGSYWSLCHGDSGEAATQPDGPKLQTSCFAGDFPPGELRKLLEPILGGRCLLPLAEVNLHSRQISLLNRDKKAIAAIEIRQSADRERRTLLLRRVRGYEGEHEVIRRILAENGVTESVLPLTSFEDACRAKGRSPLDYSQKFTLELDGDEAAREAMIRIYQALLDTITLNMPGALADYDPEFLHDIRVAIRRARSGLIFAKRVLPDSVSLSRMFRRLGAITGPTRDLDVYLLAQDDHVKRLSSCLRPGLQEFFAELSRKRQVEQKKMARMLGSRKTEALFSAWQQALKRHDRQTADLSDLPIRELADRIILKRYKRVMRGGRNLDATTPDTETHRLRLQCKKLRYAIELFGSLYPKQELKIVTRQLRKLQDILGSFNDLSVQQEMLRQSVITLAAESPQKLDQAAALGGLLQSLFQEQEALRGRFARAFARFGNQKTVMLFHKLFRKRGR